MEWISVSSSNINAVAYDEDSSTLYVKFNSGATYSYENVPHLEFSRLLSAASHGSYFASHIQYSYKYKKL